MLFLVDFSLLLFSLLQSSVTKQNVREFKKHRAGRFVKSQSFVKKKNPERSPPKRGRKRKGKKSECPEEVLGETAGVEPFP